MTGLPPVLGFDSCKQIAGNIKNITQFGTTLVDDDSFRKSILFFLYGHKEGESTKWFYFIPIFTASSHHHPSTLSRDQEDLIYLHAERVGSLRCGKGSD